MREKKKKRDFDGPACVYHDWEPATAHCSRCSSPLCKDCAETYRLKTSEYAKRCVCYDCCKTLVEENIQTLKQFNQKNLQLIAATGVGMIIGFIIGISRGSFGLGLICALWFGSAWFLIRNVILVWWRSGRSLAGFCGAVCGGLITAPFITAFKIIRNLSFYFHNAKCIREDSEALQQMHDYMEYTQIARPEETEDLDLLIEQQPELQNNLYVQTAQKYGMQAAMERLQKAAAQIVQDGENLGKYTA